VAIAPSRLLLAFASKYSVASALWRLSQIKGRRLQEPTGALEFRVSPTFNGAQAKLRPQRREERSQWRGGISAKPKYPISPDLTCLIRQIGSNY
jgi:hypothetical protein